MKVNYRLLDVFTAKRLSGNPLAVVPDADHLLDDEMQAIANEFNLSETVFLRRPQGARNTAELRIFTPQTELPFAGHPTIGAAVVLGLEHRQSAVRLEEKVGLVTALVERIDKRTGEARFALPQLPERAGKAPEPRDAALALGLEIEEIGCGIYHPDVFSAGNLFYLVPVRDAGALRRIALNEGHWRHAFPLGRHSVYVFSQTPEEPDNDFAARMVARGNFEDPGTGSAAAALIGLLAEKADLATGQADYVLRQGHEMGRPCRITMQLHKEDDVLVHAAIGGRAVVVGEGVLDLGE